MKSVILLLLLVSNPSLPNTWAEGEFYLKMSKEINKRIVIKRETQGLFAYSYGNKIDEDHPIPVSEMTHQEIQDFFNIKSTLADSIKCISIARSKVCLAKNDLVIPAENVNIKVKKGYFGVVEDIGLFEVSKVRKLRP